MKFANGVKKFLGQALGETAPNGKEGSDATIVTELNKLTSNPLSLS